MLAELAKLPASDPQPLTQDEAAGVLQLGDLWRSSDAEGKRLLAERYFERIEVTKERAPYGFRRGTAVITKIVPRPRFQALFGCALAAAMSDAACRRRRR